MRRWNLHRLRVGSVARFVWGLAICILLGHTAWAGEDHDHDHPEPGGAAKAPVPRPGASAPVREAEEGCPVNPAAIADFANGERYDYPNLVAYLATPSCQGVSRQVTSAALASGVTFHDKPPYRLDNYAKALSKVDLESAKKLDLSLGRSIPSLLRSNPLSSTEVLPLLGQLALLSMSAARSTLAYVIQQELFAGDSRMAVEGPKGKEMAAAELARTLVRLGAAESAIASEVAENVEEMALLSQADSLSRIFRALSAAASIDASLVPTFNLSAGAFNRGVQRGKELFVESDRADLVMAAFAAIKASMSGTGALEPGAAELNEALGALMGGKALSASSLKKAWKEAVRVLAQSPSQTALAEAVALSLTPQIIFLTAQDREALLLAAKGYPSLASSVQMNFLSAWQKVWDDLHEGRLRPRAFNRMRERYFEPIVAEILDFDPYLINAFWLKEVLRRGLVQDEDVEKRFPRFVLAYLDRRERASKVAVAESGPESTLSSMAEDFTVLWTLANVHVPALVKWVRKYEQ